jgi:hypothetical protein
MDDAQWQLVRWGSFWRQRGYTHLGYPRVNTICRMMHAAKLGVSVQSSRREPEIYVPPDVEMVGNVIAELPQRERRIVSLVYQKQLNRKSLNRQSPDDYRALLRGEARVYASLGAFRHTP